MTKEAAHPNQLPSGGGRNVKSFKGTNDDDGAHPAHQAHRVHRSILSCPHMATWTSILARAELNERNRPAKASPPKQHVTCTIEQALYLGPLSSKLSSFACQASSQSSKAFILPIPGDHTGEREEGSTNGPRMVSEVELYMFPFDEQITSRPLLILTPVGSLSSCFPSCAKQSYSCHFMIPFLSR